MYKSESEVTQLCPTLRDPHGLQPTRLCCPWDFPGKSTGMGCHCLLGKNNRHIFPFHQELYWTMYSPSCSTTFCHFSGNFIILSSKTFYLFEQRTFQVPFKVSQGIEIFSIKTFVKTEINGHPKIQCMVNIANESELPSQAVTDFAWSPRKRTYSLMVSGWEIIHFLLTNSKCFSSRATFSWFNWEQSLLELIVWFFRRSS